jgi:hypothetical protein
VKRKKNKGARGEDKPGEDEPGEERPPTSPKSTLMQPFVSMLRPRAHEFNKNEAPKDERVRRVYNE